MMSARMLTRREVAVSLTYLRLRLEATADSNTGHSAYKKFAALADFGVFPEIDGGGEYLSSGFTVLGSSYPSANEEWAIDANLLGSWEDRSSSLFWFEMEGYVPAAQSVRIRFRRPSSFWGVPQECVLKKWNGSSYDIVSTFVPAEEDTDKILNLALV